MRKDIKIFSNTIEDEAIRQFNEAMNLDCNVQGALMPDAHAGYTLPIGAVIKSDGYVFPSYVGYDIGCGMCAVNIDITKDDINLEQLKKHIIDSIPLGSNKHKEKQNINISKDSYNISDFAKYRIEDTGIYQIGTLGGGNHFIEVGESQNNKSIWIVIHSGSRGLGYKIADYYMSLATQDSVNIEKLEEEFIFGKEIFKNVNPDAYKKAFKIFVEKQWNNATKNKEGHFGFKLDSELAKAYIEDMNYCLDFALENRRTMIDTIINGIEAQLNKKVNELLFINRNHNHAEIKESFVIHRKGATHAENGMFGVIPANMKDGSFIVKGKGNNESMCSSSHGAGRVLSRKKAKESLNINEFYETMKNIITNHTYDTLDESPKAYKNIFEVMELQKDLVEVIDRSIPILNIKG